MKIIPALPYHSADIARLIMMAMTDDCCQHLAGPGHTLDDFRRTMVRLVQMDDSQYSWRNAFVAIDDEAPSGPDYDGRMAGAVVGYDGGELHRLRRRFIEAALADWDMDHTGMDDETQAGEFYIDSLAVMPEYRHQGIASSLLHRIIQRANGLGLPAALLVDKGNPGAERLYTSLGFEHRGDAIWGGHGMKHLVHRAKQ